MGVGLDHIEAEPKDSGVNDLLNGGGLFFGEEVHEGGCMGKGMSTVVLKCKSDWNTITLAGLSPFSQGNCQPLIV